MSTCTVCCDKYNKTQRIKVMCPHCDYEACKTCIQTYLLSTTEEPHCMKCKHEHDREFIDSFCTKRFRNVEYRKHREQILYEREMARMPETQPYAEYRIKMKELRLRYFELLDQMFLLRDMRREAINMRNSTLDYDDAIAKMRRDIEEIVEKVNSLELNVTTISSEKFTRKCPYEECRGFLDTDMKCGLCVQQFCEHCNEVIIDSDHVCDPETVETMKLINKDTKSCPKCGTMIHKIDGCAQMWCTECHTAFDWRSGRIETGRVHNPHYFEFKKRSREHGDIPCGGRPTFAELEENEANVNILDLSYKLTLLDRDIIYRYDGIGDDDNLRLRVDYLIKIISDDEFKKELQRRDKHKCKLEDIRNIYGMFSDTCGDLLRQWMIDPTKTKDIMRTVHALADYSNRVITKIRNRYNCSVPYYIFLRAL